MDLVLLTKLALIVAALTLIIYIVRGVMMLTNSPMTNSRAIHGIASIITLVLFGLGVYIGFGQHLSFADGYMLSQIIGLLLFVAFGVIALKQGLSKPVAIVLWLIGLAAFIYTVLIATHQFDPFF